MRAERFRVVSVLDDELTMTMSERLAYATSRDFATVEGKKRPGGKPTIFHVREVPHGLWEEYVDAPDAYPEKYKRAFMCGIEKVENVLQLDGIGLANWAPNTVNTRTNTVIMADDDLRLFSPAERQEIGSVIYMHSFLPRRIAATYLLPSTLREPLTSLELRLAVVNQNAAAVTASAEHSDQTSPKRIGTDSRSTMDGAGSDNPTPAVALASGT